MEKISSEDFGRGGMIILRPHQPQPNKVNFRLLSHNQGQVVLLVGDIEGNNEKPTCNSEDGVEFKVFRPLGVFQTKPVHLSETLKKKVVSARSDDGCQCPGDGQWFGNLWHHPQEAASI